MIQISGKRRDVAVEQILLRDRKRREEKRLSSLEFFRSRFESRSRERHVSATDPPFSSSATFSCRPTLNLLGGAERGTPNPRTREEGVLLRRGREQHRTVEVFYHQSPS